MRIRAWAVFFSLLILASGLFGCYAIRAAMRRQQLGGTSGLVSTISLPESKSLKEIIRETQRLVVQIEDFWGYSVGSGFLCNEKGDIITNAHVVGDAGQVKVKLANGKTYTGTVIGCSGQVDVALVRVEELVGTKPLAIARDYKAAVGDEVVALGSPLGFQNTATTGIISGLGRNLELENYRYRGVYQISAPITFGNSGGPLILARTGEVVGVNFGGTSLGNIGFAIPIAQVLPLVENWSAHPQQAAAPASVDASEVSPYEAEELVAYYYERVNSGDYYTAYSLLGNAWKKSTPYEKMRNGYLDTIAVEVLELASREIDPQLVEVFVTIEALERGESGERTSQYKGSYKVGLENGRLRILSGKMKKL